MLDADIYHWSTGRRAGGWGRERVGSYPVMMRIIQGDLSDPRVVDLLRIHLTSARAATAPGSAHALDLSDLQSSEISFWTIWENEILLGIGALKRLSADHGELNVCSPLALTFSVLCEFLLTNARRFGRLLPSVSKFSGV
jgi:hypothetical protein